MQERWFETDGLWVHTITREPASRTPGALPVLLVHGLGASTLSWDLVASRIADEWGTSVTVIDLPGFGRTRCTDRAAAFETHRAVVTAVLEELGPAVVMGNSMGGAISSSVAAQRPELVRGLVLVNAAYPRPTGNFDHLTRTMRYAMLALPKAATPIVGARARRLGPERVVDTTLLFVIAEPDRMDPGLRDRLVALATERRDYPEAARAYAEAGGSLFRHLLGPMRDELTQIVAPTLVLHGRRDRLVPVSFARAVARRRPEWRYVEIADCGHAPQIELPDRFVEVVSRWASRDLLDRATPA